jgi:hypothetical protein
MRIWLFFAMSLGALAQIERPRMGVMLDQNGDARPVVGLAASATLGDPILSGVISLACSAQQCLAKTDTSLLASSGESVDAPPGPAILAAPYVYFTAARQLVRWHDGQLQPLDFAPDGEVLSLRANGDGLDYAVRRGDEIWIEHISFSDQSIQLLAAPGPANAVMLLEGESLLASDDIVRLLRGDGSEAAFDVAGVREFFAMGESCIELVTAQDRWVLDLRQERVFLLPGALP